MTGRVSTGRGRARISGSIASLAALLMLIAGVGAAPAQADQTVTAWIPLRCAVAGSIPAAVGAALTTTIPDSVTPGEQFSMVDTSTITIFPNSAQQSAGAFGGDAVQGIISDFETNLTNASSAFATTAGGNPVNSSPTQFNAVGAVQPPNQPAVAGPSGPRINGGDTTRGGFQPATPAETFAFGDVPADTSGATPTEYGPTPGVGGGPNPTDGTPDTLPPVGPLTATGSAGDTIVIQNKNPGGTPEVPVVGGPRVVADAISFHQPGDTYTGQLPADCAYDTRPPDTTPPNIGGDGSVPKPVSSWVDQIEIPIVAGGGGGSAPTVTSLNPAHGPEAGGTSVVITGTNFTGATDVKFGGTSVGAGNFTVDSGTQVTATAPAGTGTVDVTVTSPGGTSPPSGTGNDYAYDPATAPTVTSIDPSHGSAAGGTSVTINGSEFTGASAVKFGAGNATNVQVNAAGTKITATSPAGTGGDKVNVLVTNGVGTSTDTAADDYTYDTASSGGGGSGGGGVVGAMAGGSQYKAPKLTLGGAKLKSATKAVLTVTTTGPGKLIAIDANASGLVLHRASASKKKSKKALIKKSRAHAAQAGTMKLRVRLSKAGKKAQKRHGNVNVRVMVKFIPSGQSTSGGLVETKRLTFMKCDVTFRK